MHSFHPYPPIHRVGVFDRIHNLINLLPIYDTKNPNCSKKVWFTVVRKIVDTNDDNVPVHLRPEKTKSPQEFKTNHAGHFGSRLTLVEPEGYHIFNYIAPCVMTKGSKITTAVLAVVILEPLDIAQGAIMQSKI